MGADRLAESSEATRGPNWTAGWLAILIIVGAAIATRVVTFGNPLVDMDDQFYWLVGRSWLNGEWPILDIWDRKPVGLFLLYAGIASIDRSILAVQFAALAAAAGTAFLIRQAALSIARSCSALLAAVTYLMFLPVFGGQSGQSPVFYNLFMAGAAVLLLRASAEGNPAKVQQRAYAAMLLSGLALVCKQVSVAEGVYFGLAFLWLFRRLGMPIGKIVGTGIFMVGIALLPTVMGAALFLMRGEQGVEAYVQASYWSIFTKTAGGGQSLTNGVYYLLIFGGALIVAAAIGVATSPTNDGDRVRQRLITGWIGAAIVGYLLVPYFLPHYALPLLVPLSVMAARAFDRSIGLLLFLALAASCLMTGRLTDITENRGAAADYKQLTATIEKARHGSCVYIANGPVSIYNWVPRCPVTPYVFPFHLTLATEATAVNVEQAHEIAKIFAARPGIVLTQDDKASKQTSAVRELLARELAANYRLVSRFPGNTVDELRTLRVWQRKDLGPPQG